MDKDIQLIIPMSGIGQRFIDAGYTTPKPLIEVDGYPMIKHVVDLFPGVSNISFICNDVHLKTTNMLDILESISNCPKIYEVTAEKKGPVKSVVKIFPFIDDDKEVIVSYCDYGTKWDFDLFLNTARENDVDGSIACYTGFHPHMLGSDNYAFCREDHMIVKEVREKEPFTSNKMNEQASNGTYYFKSGRIMKKYFLEQIDKEISINGEYYVSLVYNLMIKDGLKVNCFEIENMLQWGTPYDLANYKYWSNYFSKKQISSKDYLNTTLVLPMAGKGNRFSEDGYDLPKPLIDIDGKPMVIRAVESLPNTSKQLFICLDNHIHEYGIDMILNEHYPDSIILPIDKTTEGQACTCNLGIEFANIYPDSPILISACDNGVYYDREKYDDLLKDESIDVIVWSFRNNQTSKINPNMYSWLETDNNDMVKHVSCKNFIYDDPIKTHAIIGTMFFRKSKYFTDGYNKNYLQNIRTNGEFYVDDVLNQNIKDGLSVKVFEVDNYICWGTPNDYKTYNYWKDFFKTSKTL